MLREIQGATVERKMKLEEIKLFGYFRLSAGKIKVKTSGRERVFDTREKIFRRTVKGLSVAGSNKRIAFKGNDFLLDMVVTPVSEKVVSGLLKKTYVKIPNEQFNELLEIKRRANEFYLDVLPQIGSLAIQSFDNLNQLGILLEKCKGE